MNELSALALRIEWIAERLAETSVWAEDVSTLRRTTRVINALDEGHVPRADDDVAAWLKRMRDAIDVDEHRYNTAMGQVTSRRRSQYEAIDRLLDRYRECAACSLSLRPEDDEQGYP